MSHGRPQCRSIPILFPLALVVALTGCASVGTPTAPQTPETAFAPALALSTCTPPAGPGFVAGPYVTEVSATGATLMLKLGGEVDVTFRLLEYDGACRIEDVFSSGVRVPAKQVDAGAVPYYQTGDAIAERLYYGRFDVSAATADRRFCYGIEMPPTPWAEINRYFCPPDLAAGRAGTSFVVPATEGDELIFYVYGDTRDPLGFSPLHAAVVDLMTADLVADLAAGQKPASFVINTGDFAFSGCDPELWEENFFSPTRVLLQGLPIFTAPGNHEYYDSVGGQKCPHGSYYFSFFGPTYRTDPSSPPGMYVADYKNVRFISLKLISYDDDGGLDPAACSGDEKCGAAGICGYKWLRCQLLAAEADDAIDHVFIVHHAPLITAPPATKHPSSDFQIAHLAPLLERPDGTHPGKVVAVVNGHNHFYERSAPLSNLCLESDKECRDQWQPACPDDPTPSGFQFPAICYDEDPHHGITYLISGGGGAAPYEAPPGPFPIRWLQAAHGAYHYLKIRVSGAGATLEARGFDGQGQPFCDDATLR